MLSLRRLFRRAFALRRRGWRDFARGLLGGCQYCSFDAGRMLEETAGGGGIKGLDVPCEYSFACMSGCSFSSHSSHFLVVPPNSQYYGGVSVASRARRVPGSYLLLVVVCILRLVSAAEEHCRVYLTATVCDLDWYCVCHDVCLFWSRPELCWWWRLR